MDLYKLVVAKKMSGGGGGDEPSGTINITSNGSHNVKSYATASVSVPVGVFPSGTSSITANGIYDITNFASVDVNVSGGGGGGITVDEIAERTISGVVSGSASIVGTNAFQACSSITAAYFPSAKSIGVSAFANCTMLQSVSFPLASRIGSSAFWFCSSLSVASFPSLRSLYGSAFSGCSMLMSVYLLSTTMATLNNSNVFSNTPMLNSTYTGSFGSIYVPSSLLSSYKTANNWSYYSARITSYVE